MDSSINQDFLYPILSLERIDDPPRIQIEGGGSCFICGNTPQIPTPSLTPKIIFFKSNLEEWKNDDNNETCSACLPLINQVHSLNREIISLQMFIRNIVAAAHAKRSAKKVLEKMFFKTVKPEEDEEDEEESNWSTAILGEEIEQDNYNKKDKRKKRRINNKESGATSKKIKVAVATKVEMEEETFTPIKIEDEQEEFNDVQEDNEFSNFENLVENPEETEEMCGARPSRKCKTVQERKTDLSNEDKDEYIEKNDESNEEGEDYDLNDYSREESDSSSEEDFTPAVVWVNNRKYFCCNVEGCQTQLINLTNLRGHVKRHKIESDPNWNAARGGYNCTNCGLRIKEKDRFLLHTKVCVNQEQSTPEEEEIVNEKNEDKKFSCTICFKKFKKKGHMKTHIQVMHLQEKPFPCEFCDLRYSSIAQLKVHHVQIHKKDPRPFQCDLCNTQFVLKEQLDLHPCSEKPFLCDHCGQEFKNLELVSHLRTAHPEIPHEKVFKCFEPSCGKMFPNRSKLNRHLMNHEKRNYECELCHKQFVKKFQLGFHLETHEIKQMEKHLGCTKCTKRFSIQQKLDFHMDFHSKEQSKPFGCEQCEVRFNSKDKLDKHLTEVEAHNESVSHLCQYCSKSFPLRRSLIKHERSVHTRNKELDKKVECRFCGRVLKVKSYLKHVKIVHKKEKEEEEKRNKEKINEEVEESSNLN